MTIKKTMRTAFFALTFGVFLALLISTRVAYLGRTDVIEEEDYILIREQSLAELAMSGLTDTEALTEELDCFLSRGLSDTNYRYRITDAEDEVFTDITLSDSGTFLNGNRVFGQLCGYFQVPDTEIFVILWAESEFNVAPLGMVNLLQITLSLAASLLLTIFLAEVISRSITKPLSSLLSTIREAADGNLSARCQVDTKNEIGELARNFNKMLHIINSNYEDLSSMHEELLANEEELRKNYDHIEFLAYHDVLTQLPNKIAFYDKVFNTLNSRHASSQKHAIYFVDLDNFKTINDTLGHDYGDELLAQTASTLNNMMRPGDILSRAGGDEFLIFRAGITSQEDAVEFGEYILETFKKPFDLNGETAYISMSIGISIYPLNGLSHTILIKNADIAMYHSKDSGKNKVTVFNSEMEDQLQRQAEILEILRHAIETREVYLVYQPQFRQTETGENEVASFEALMRINNAKLGHISPAEFIPIAENNGLIYDLGLWSLREACTMNKNLIDRGFRPRTVAVNLSSLQLNRSDFQAALEQILKETGLPPEYLELELTESMLVSSVSDAAKQLRALRSLGVRIALDDFGTGYSSLNYLTQMPINTLKIDKSFIDNICTNERDSKLAGSIIFLAHSLSITVLAEGVEQEAQLSLLRENGCDLIQGYLLSRPILPEQLAELLD